jgi:hypothetical protein
VSFILLNVSILWRPWGGGAHNSACTVGGGDSHGANGVVNDDAGAGTFDDDPMAMYLGYNNV